MVCESPKPAPDNNTMDKMRYFQKYIHITLFLMAAFIILLTFTFQDVPFLKLEFFKPSNFKPSNESLLPIRFKSKWNSLWKKNDPSEALSNEITVLTAYFNLGSFIKGHKGNVYTPQRYMMWMKTFGRINNKMVIYTDDKATYELFSHERENFPKEHTKLFLVNRTELWSFQIRDQIANIYKQPGYPKHYPNTVLPEYSCAMHAKFELLAKVITENYFKTKYFMWLDIGLFRDLPRGFEFGLSVPKDFNESKVAYSLVYDFKPKVDYKTVINRNLVWVGGASNLGTHDVLYTFTQEYIEFVKKSLKMKIISTDQQIIYGMYLEQKKPKTQLQLYKSGWFFLGYKCYKTWLQEQDKKQNKHKS